MLSRRIKAGYFFLAGPFMRFNGIFYKFFKAPRTGIIRVHLGPGQRNYLPRWINVDANMFTAKCDVWTDLRYALPFHDATIDAVYSHHVVEHLPNLRGHFQEVFRCLKPGGTYRVAGPNGDTAIAKFIANDTQWFGDFPEKRTSIGGRFENFVFCRQEHLTILTYSFIEELMTATGFVNLKKCLPAKVTHHKTLFDDCLAKESETDIDFPHTLIIEGEKPT